MSFNRLIYDSCATAQQNNESVGVLDYVLDPVRMENPQKCRHQLGLVGGANVSQVQGNIVDLETDLMGITRKASNCPCKKYLNRCAVSEDPNSCQRKSIPIQPNFSTIGRNINTELVHLPNCQTIDYSPIPLPGPVQGNHCGNNIQQVRACQNKNCNCQ
mgnify:FL=1|jgi:hypothetical protein